VGCDSRDVRLPAALGDRDHRGKANAPAIGVINFFAGWTVIGWFIALGMAVGSHRVSGLRVWTAPGR
jgi:hypothetical protein